MFCGDQHKQACTQAALCMTAKHMLPIRTYTTTLLKRMLPIRTRTTTYEYNGDDQHEYASADRNTRPSGLAAPSVLVAADDSPYGREFCPLSLFAKTIARALGPYDTLEEACKAV